MSIPKLPPWSIPNTFPAFFDHESATSIEMTAKLYNAMQELIEEYASFSKRIEESFTQFSDGNNKELEEFKVGLRQEFQDFIDIVDLKIKGFENDVRKAVAFMTENIDKTVNDYLVNTGARIEIVYNEETEDISFLAKSALSE